MTVSSFALPHIQRGLAIPENEIGALFALLRFGTVFSLALAVLSDRLGRRGLLIASVVGCALCNLGTAFAWNGLSFAWLQMGARFFLGAQVLLAVVVVTEELAAENRGFGLGMLAALSGMGGAFTLVVYAFVDRLPFGWRSLYVIGAFGLLCVPWLLRSLPETRRFTDHNDRANLLGSRGSLWEPLGDLVRRHRQRLMVLIAVVLPASIILDPASVFISKHLQDDLGYTPAQVGLLIAGCGIAAPLGNVLTGSISDRFGRRPITALMSLLLSVGTALFYFAAGPYWMVVGLTVLFISFGGLGVLHAALAAELFPTSLRSTATGVREAIATLGASLGLGLLSVAFGPAGGNISSMAWLLVLTPIAPIALLWMPETASRELEEIHADAAVESTD
jgi:MFS family permease